MDSGKSCRQFRQMFSFFNNTNDPIDSGKSVIRLSLMQNSVNDVNDPIDSGTDSIHRGNDIKSPMFKHEILLLFSCIPSHFDNDSFELNQTCGGMLNLNCFSTQHILPSFPQKLF